jgi:ribosomal protein S18 acetylase RimI-like enzyme
MNASYQLRPVSLRDAANLQTACWPNWSIEAIREVLQRVDGIARRGRGIGIVACSKHGILGYGQLTLWPRTAEISDLIVTPACRGHGIGTAIINHLVDRVRAWHMAQVEIGVALGNQRALALYQRLGFTQDRIINLDLGHGVEPVMYLSMGLDE